MLTHFALRWDRAVVAVRVAGDEALVDMRVPWRNQWLVVRETLPVPKGRDFDGRANGLWLSLVCETPGEHWTIGLEAFALAVDDPDDERGDLVPLGLDLEWEAPGSVYGEVLIGDERIELDEPATLDVS